MSELIGASADPSLPPGSEGPPFEEPPGPGAPAGGAAPGTRSTCAGPPSAWRWAPGSRRLTGVARVLALAYALGFTRLADAYNLANTTPNMLYDVVLGGVLSATFIPVFVDRLATRSERDAWRAISAVVTLSVVVLAGASVVFFLAAPLIISAFTALDHTHGGLATASLGHERAVATTLLRWFVPQVFFYGLIALATALLNTRRKFGAPAWVPIANNLVSVGVLLWFHHVAGVPSLLGAQLHRNQLVLLGLGTTLGVVVQALLLLPSLGRARLRRLTWRWEPGHEAVRTVVRLGAWTFGFVMANQVALFVVLALAVGAGGAAPVSSYTYAYTFLQMPYAVVAVSVMSAVTPDLSEKWATGDRAGFRRRMAGGLRAVLAIIVPAATGMLLLAKPAVAAAAGPRRRHPGPDAPTRAPRWPSSPWGCPASAPSSTWCGCSSPCSGPASPSGSTSSRTASTSGSPWPWSTRSGCGASPCPCRWPTPSGRCAAWPCSASGWARLGPPRAFAPLRRVLAATAVMGVVVLVVSNLSGAESGVGLFVRVVGSAVVGVAVYFATAAVLANRSHRRRPPAAAGVPRRRSLTLPERRPAG